MLNIENFTPFYTLMLTIHAVNCIEISDEIYIWDWDELKLTNEKALCNPRRRRLFLKYLSVYMYTIIS